MSREIIRNALENYLEIVAIEDSFEAAEALRYATLMVAAEIGRRMQ